MNTFQIILKSKAFKIVLFLVLSWVLFNCIFFLGTHPTKLINSSFQFLFLKAWNNVSNILLRDFLVFGFLTGLGGFLVYVPNILLLFLFSHVLFETGLTVKAARLVDPLFRPFGLNGYSFPPLLFGFGCSVNALHSAQNIDNKKNRLLTMLITPFMSCGSKFAVYVLLISVVFSGREAGTVLFGLYIIGIVFSLVSALIFRTILKIKKDDTYEDITDSPLKKPDMMRIAKDTGKDGWIFCKKAGTVIVIASIIIWAFSYWPGISHAKYHELLEEANKIGQPIPPRITLSFHTSYAARFGQFIEPIFIPLGQNWKNSVALVSSLAGRGIIISSLITMYGIEYGPEGEKTLVKALQADESFSKLSALTLMLFVLLCGSCLASVTMFLHETKSIGLTALFGIYPVIVAWIVSVLFYQISKVIIN